MRVELLVTKLPFSEKDACKAFYYTYYQNMKTYEQNAGNVVELQDEHSEMTEDGVEISSERVVYHVGRAVPKTVQKILPNCFTEVVSDNQTCWPSAIGKLYSPIKPDSLKLTLATFVLPTFPNSNKNAIPAKIQHLIDEFGPNPKVKIFHKDFAKDAPETCVMYRLIAGVVKVALVGKVVEKVAGIKLRSLYNKGYKQLIKDNAIWMNASVADIKQGKIEIPAVDIESSEEEVEDDEE